MPTVTGGTKVGSLKMSANELLQRSLTSPSTSSPGVKLPVNTHGMMGEVSRLLSAGFDYIKEMISINIMICKSQFTHIL